MSAPQIKFAGQSVGRIGYGLMQLTWTPEPPAQEDSFAAMKAAADAGATAWSTAAFYGPPNNPMANLHLIAAFFKKYPDYKQKVVIALKGCMQPNLSPIAVGELKEKARAEIKACQDILGDKTIDIYLPARIDAEAPIEETMKVLKELKEEGLFTEVGLSEVKGPTLERAYKVCRVAVLEIEVSLWSYDSDIKAALSSAQSLGVPVFAYSPLGRGFITRKWSKPEDIPEGSYQRMSPRFQGDNFYQNLKLVDLLDEAAQKKGVETSQLALGWVVGLNDVTIPIPGSSKPDRVRHNTESAQLKLSDEELKKINDILASFEPAGGRYPEQAAAHLMQ
ncbi:NADP-dependent oxidoreductase domain-containing protein [Dioszegia hungarica]|uniref:NADP-dependent oxidoreductase domain-containing protein n=1 Tax=Dioszegia hungarica TaxID=4972 RepID=A0AA38HFZ4_9TREE|nr:NADP-dependent oxidoreductase domain-containing protein [Dioszegia hungarica]KAI9639860.1 NADP-dependent oxidoreductase domain-containing protein [Dioszegia hungarica]